MALCGPKRSRENNLTVSLYHITQKRRISISISSLLEKYLQRVAIFMCIGQTKISGVRGVAPKIYHISQIHSKIHIKNMYQKYMYHKLYISCTINVGGGVAWNTNMQISQIPKSKKTQIYVANRKITNNIYQVRSTWEGEWPLIQIYKYISQIINHKYHKIFLSGAINVGGGVAQKIYHIYHKYIQKYILEILQICIKNIFIANCKSKISKNICIRCDQCGRGSGAEYKYTNYKYISQIVNYKYCK